MEATGGVLRLQRPDPEYVELKDGSLTLPLPVNGVAVLQVIK